MSGCNGLENLKNLAASAQGNASDTNFSSYQAAVNNLQNAINICMDTGVVQQVGDAAQGILADQKTLKELKEDLDIARTRHEALMSGEKKVSDYQGVSGKLGFYKPLRESSVPVLISVGLFVIFAAVYAFSILTRGPQAVAGVSGGLGFFADFDKRSFIYGVGVVGIVVGALSYFGVYGKRIQ